MFWYDKVIITETDYRDMVKTLTFEVNSIEFQKRKLLSSEQSAEDRKALAGLEKELTRLRSARRELVLEMALLM